MSRKSNRHGKVIVMVAVLLPAMLGVGAFAIDVGYIAYLRAQAQAAADAAALAAILDLSEGQSAIDGTAADYSSYNLPSKDPLNVDVEPGTWDEKQAVFTASSISSANAIRVTVIRENASLFFGRLLGKSHTDIQASAVSWIGESDCFTSGSIIAGDVVQSAQGLTQSGYCVYGRNGVEYNDKSFVGNGGKAGSLKKGNIKHDNKVDGLPENIIAGDYQPTLSNNIFSTFTDFKNGHNWPPQIVRVKHYKSASHLPHPLSPGTIYLFDESISIDQNYTATDVIIMTKKNISFGQDGGIFNTGTPTNDYAIGLYAGETITIGQDASIVGVNIASGKDVILGQDLAAFDATIQAKEKVNIGEDTSLYAGGWKPAMEDTITANSSSNTDGGKPSLVN